MNKINDMVNLIVSAYIKVYGIEKWNSLTETQQHDAIMMIANSALNAME